MQTYFQGKTFLKRLGHGDDLLAAIRAAFVEARISMGVFEALGAVRQARIAFYDQKTHEYCPIDLNEQAEILSCIGNVSLLAGEPFVHAHITLSLADGSAKGGHLMEGTTIFACELFGRELVGKRLERAYDATTGLKLWEGA
jgi:uncharacterized protein